MTSRSHSAQVLGIVKPIEVKELLPGEALAFVLRRTGREEAGAAEREGAGHLAEELGRLPLALEQAAAFVAAREVSFQNYLTSFRGRRLALLNESAPILGSRPEPVATTWTMNFEAVADEPAAADLLRAGSFLAADDIPAEFLTRGAADYGKGARPGASDYPDHTRQPECSAKTVAPPTALLGSFDQPYLES